MHAAAEEPIGGGPSPSGDWVRMRQRVLECVPALLLAGIVALVVLLTLTAPTGLFVLGSGYVFYWALRSTEMGARQLVEYIQLRRYDRIDWAARLDRLTDPYVPLHRLEARPRLSAAEAAELKALRSWLRSGADVPTPADLFHLVVLPVANEEPAILRATLDALTAADYPPERLLVCLSFEERSRRWTDDRIVQLCSPYQSCFGLLLTTRHPDGRPGESPVKGANVTWGARVAANELRRRGLHSSQVVVSALDCDTQVGRQYFQVLSYTYLTDPGRDINGYQPVLLFHNNVWDVPVVSRLVGYIASMWTLVDSTKPDLMQLFSAHAIGLRALAEVDYWATGVIPDDSRQHWRLYLRSHGRSRTVPLHVPVYLDAVQASGLRATLAAQYRQIRRWAYGVVDFPYLMTQNRIHPEIPLGARAGRTVRQLLQFHLWASVPLLLLASRPTLAWLNPPALQEHTTLTLAGWAVTASGVLGPASLVVSIVVALLLLPQRPAHRRPAVWIGMVTEWLLLPVVVPLFLCLPAIDAQLRLLTRRYLGFRVTPKRRLPRSPWAADAVDAAH